MGASNLFTRSRLSLLALMALGSGCASTAVTAGHIGCPASETQIRSRWGTLKPSNIMLESSGRAVVLDFGIARAFAGSEMTHTETRELMGTPQYMAPEQVHGGKVDHRADIYALGVVAF